MTKNNDTRNPFTKLPGGAPPGPPTKQPERDTGLQPGEPPPGSLCPFLGGVSMPMLDQASIIKPGANPLDAIQMGVAFNACQGDRCHFWDPAKNGCHIKAAVVAHEKLVVVLEGLAERFGIQT